MPCLHNFTLVYVASRGMGGTPIDRNYPTPYSGVEAQAQLALARVAYWNFPFLYEPNILIYDIFGFIDLRASRTGLSSI